MQDFRNLIAWQKAHQLALLANRSAARMPKQGYTGLKSQLLRAAASIPANIAEGCGRQSHRDLARFAEIAVGSATELDYHLLSAKDLGLLAPEAYAEMSGLASEVRRMLIALARSIRERGPKPQSAPHPPPPAAD